MDKKKFERVLFFLFSFFIISIFCYFRLKPLLAQSVGYTFDQGRDFFEVAQMVLNKKPLLTGPTTGIIGLNHGAWWYYLLTIPFMVFGGSPIGFYYFNFFIQLGLFVYLIYFIHTYFGKLTALIAGLLIATSPYFIFTSVFVGNNVMALPALLFFLTQNFVLLENKQRKIPRTFFFIGLWLAFIAEFEIAYGLFIIPAYFMAIVLVKELRNIALSSLKRHLTAFFMGFVIPFIPRILSELQSGLTQTSALVGFIIKNRPTATSKSIKLIISDRLVLFTDYYKNLFVNESVAIFFFLLTAVLLVSLLLYRHHTYGRFLKFLGILLGILLIFSIIHKDFFWANYYEGIHYMYLFITIIILEYELKGVTVSNFLSKIAILGLLILATIFALQKEVMKPIKPTINSGLIMHQKIVDTLLQNVENTSSYCARVYTPPVIPHTYNYLFLYQKTAYRVPEPKFDWVNKQCWMIIEYDPFGFRAVKWREENIPPSSILLKKIDVINDTTIELWQLK